MLNRSYQLIRRAGNVGILLMAYTIFSNQVCRSADLILSDFNGTGFSYTFSGLNQTLGPSSVRLNDPADGWGGAGLIQKLDLSTHADSRFVVDMFTNAGNSVDQFDLELIDSVGRTGKWTFGVSNLDVGSPSTLVSATTLGNPTHGVGDFANLDLSNITTWQVLGDFNSPNPFDMNFDRVLVSDTVAAPPPYEGADPNAPWRVEAATRIDAIRKADIQVNVTDSLGNALSGANVQLQMKRHEFGFGSAVQAVRLRDNNPAYDAYKQKTSELFNLATIENNLKWPPWEGEWGNNFTQQGALDASSWLAQQNIDVRGHAMVWPGYSNLPLSVKAILDNAPLDANQQNQLRNVIAAHIADIGGTFAGQLSAWDVINEPRSNRDIMDNLSEGDSAMVDWFTQAKAVDSNASLFINDFGILTSAGGTNTSNQQDYIDRVQFLLDNSAPVEGIGFQAHFTEGTLTGPEQLWTVLDRFDQLGLKMQITEFDFGTSDEQLQADFTRDFLTAIFAHEGIDDFLMWGFWENAHWRPEAALFRSDWSIKPNGQAYMDLVFDQWWTDENLETSNGGLVDLRGFKGEYEVVVSHNGQVEIVTASLSEDGLVLDISLPTLSADFDGDGNVDNNDLAIWSASFGLASGAVQANGDADGDGDVDGTDFLLWQQQFGTAVSVASFPVPEPANYALLLVVAVVFIGCSRSIDSKS